MNLWTVHCPFVFWSATGPIFHPAHFAEFGQISSFLIWFVLFFILISEINGRIPTYFEIAIVT
jgi:hypothetical protein